MRFRRCLRCGAPYLPGAYRAHLDAAHGDGEMVAAWRSGLSGPAVGKRFGCTREYVRQVLARNGIASMRHPTPPRLPPVLACRICGADYTVGTFRQHARERRHAMLPTSPRPLSRRTRAMAAAYARGEPIATIARRFGVTPAAVCHAAVQRSGLPPRYKDRAGTRRHRDVLAAFRRGEPNWLIAEQNGLSLGRVGSLRQQLRRELVRQEG